MDGMGDHRHEGFEVPAGVGAPSGRPVDYPLLGRLLGTAADGCTSCQDPLMPLLVEDAVTTARLVELACILTSDQLGDLPASMSDDDAPGLSSTEFRALVRAGLGGGDDGLHAACAQMPVSSRRAAANSALDLVVGYLLGPGAG